MKNEEKRDQLIRETFDQCLSGIDNLPSKRTDILRKTEDQTKTRRQPRFRVTAAAAALVVLLCIGVMAVSGWWGTVHHPDTIRPGNRSPYQRMKQTGFPWRRDRLFMTAERWLSI